MLYSSFYAESIVPVLYNTLCYIGANISFLVLKLFYAAILNSLMNNITRMFVIIIVVQLSKYQYGQWHVWCHQSYQFESVLIPRDSKFTSQHETFVRHHTAALECSKCIFGLTTIHHFGRRLHDDTSDCWYDSRSEWSFSNG